MPNVTSTRTVALTPQFFTDNGANKTPRVYNTGRANPVQTTTSFRTGGVQTEDLSNFNSDAKFNYSQLSKESQDSRNSGDSGHAFSTIRQGCDDGLNHLSFRGNPAGSFTESRYEYEGPVFLNLLAAPTGHTGTFPSPYPAYTTLTQDGVKAISKTMPTLPAANLAQGVAEIVREGFPHTFGASALKHKADLARVAGKEYLNLEFGWKPLVSDVISAAFAVKESARILQQYQRDSGRNVRRTFAFPDVESTTSATYFGNTVTNGIPVFAQQALVSGSPSVTSIIHSHQRKWFKGAYTYHANLHPSGMEKLGELEKKANLLLGLRLTPEVLWELAPWSWLADWQANIGENMTNVSHLGQDGLVMRYGYMMVQSTVTWTRTWTVSFKAGGSATQSFVSSSQKKERYRATPYGFGLNPDSFSGKQWSILGALGLTKAPRALG